MTPRTDKERILQLEARCAELESELAEYRRQEVETPTFANLDPMRDVLRRAHAPAGGQMIAIMLTALLDASPRFVSRDRMFTLTRHLRSWADQDGQRRSVDVQICKLRKALANLSASDVIRTMNGRGWAIEPNDRDRIKAALRV